MKVYNHIQGKDMDPKFPWQSVTASSAYRDAQIDVVVDGSMEVRTDVGRYTDLVKKIVAQHGWEISNNWLKNAVFNVYYTQRDFGKIVNASEAMKAAGENTKGTYKNQNYNWEYRTITISGREYGYAESERKDGMRNVSIAMFYR